MDTPGELCNIEVDRNACIGTRMLYRSRVKRKKTFEHAEICGFRSSYVCANNYPGICSPFIYSVVSNVLLADSEDPDQTMDVQAALGLCCPHMFEDTFSPGAARMETTTKKQNGQPYSG